jgi:hypothetical protein
MDPSFRQKKKQEDEIPQASPALQQAIDDYERTRKTESLPDAPKQEKKPVRFIPSALRKPNSAAI